MGGHGRRRSAVRVEQVDGGGMARIRAAFEKHALLACAQVQNRDPRIVPGFRGLNAEQYRFAAGQKVRRAVGGFAFLWVGGGEHLRLASRRRNAQESMFPWPRSRCQSRCKNDGVIRPPSATRGRARKRLPITDCDGSATGGRSLL